MANITIKGLKKLDLNINNMEKETDTFTRKKVVLISGGSRGLGSVIVSKCLKLGYRVATFSRSETNFVQELYHQDPENETFLWRAVEGSDRQAIKNLVTEVNQCYGQIDVLINNAGIGFDGVLPLMRTSDIEQLIDVNLKGTIFLTQACSRVMIQQQSGCIINISSVNAIRGHSGVAIYSATKAALDGLTRSLARELGQKNIRVNSVAPGYFESEMVSNLTEKTKQQIIRRTPLGRLANIEEIANVLLFLMSAQASFITGQTIIVDGGITC